MSPKKEVEREEEEEVEEFSLLDSQFNRVFVCLEKGLEVEVCSGESGFVCFSLSTARASSRLSSRLTGMTESTRYVRPERNLHTVNRVVKIFYI